MTTRRAPGPGQLTLDGFAETSTTLALREELLTEQTQNAFLVEQMTELTESLTDLERSLYEPGWQHLTQSVMLQFSRAGLVTLAQICRVMSIADPLIRRAVSLRTAYVWGQGVSISARANTEEEGQDVNAVVQAFLDDELNRAAFTGAQAQQQAEHTLETGGNFFVALFTKPRSGWVSIRSLISDEIVDKIKNPDDRTEVWYYRREWTRQQVNGGSTHEVDYYPDIDYRPRPGQRLTNINGHVVHWDAPILHVKVNTPEGWDFGIPDMYPAVEWARAYKETLNDWVRLIKALSRIAWKLTSKGSKAATSAAIKRKPSMDVRGEPNAAGATAVLGPDATLEAIPKTGATIDAESFRPLAMQVASATDLPVTMLLSDPGQTGARATAETLDTPTELVMGMRRSTWSEAIRKITGYVIREAVRAPAGKLQGTVTLDPDTGREVTELTDETDPTVDIVWPDITGTDVTQMIAAIVQADQTEKIPPLVVLRLLLEALKVGDIDEILADAVDEQGNFVQPGISAGQAAVDAFQRGQDPAAVVGSGNPPPEPAADQPPPPAE